jgi:hypothetical protein
MQFDVNIRLYEYWHEQVNFHWEDDDEVRNVLDQHVRWVFTVLAHWNKSNDRSKTYLPQNL